MNNPCEDPQYLALKAQPVDSLSEREYEVLRERDQACMEVQKVTSMITAGSERPAPKLDPRLLEARTQAGPFARSSEIVIRNNSQVAVIITSVRLYDCINIRGVCGLSRPNVRIDPGQERRVGLVRFAAGDNPASYHFEYFFEPVANP